MPEREDAGPNAGDPNVRVDPAAAAAQARVNAADKALAELDQRIAIQQTAYDTAAATYDEPIYTTDDNGDQIDTGRKRKVATDPPAASAAKTRIAVLERQRTQVLNERTAAIKERNAAITADHAEQGTPLTPQDIAILDADVRKAEADATLAESKVAAAEAQAASDADPANVALKQRAADAELTRYEAQTASEQQATAAATFKQQQDELLAPYAVREAAASAEAAEFTNQKNVDWLDIDRRQAEANIRYTAASAGASEAETEKLVQLLKLGWPEVEIERLIADTASTRASTASTELETEQTRKGELVTLREQLKAAIERGDMEPGEATDFWNTARGYGTPQERRQEGSANAAALNQTNLQYGLYTPKGGFDPGGVMGKGLSGLVGSQVAFDNSGGVPFRDYAQQIGVDITPEQGVPMGADRPAWLQSITGGVPEVDLNPDQLAAAIATGEVGGPPGQPAAAPEAAAAPPTAAVEPAIQTATGPPPEPVLDADAVWQAGVDASPVLKAAEAYSAQHGEPRNAEPAANGTTLITYTDGTRKWFNTDGTETTEPAPSAAAPAGGGGITINVTGAGSAGSAPAPAPSPGAGDRRGGGQPFVPRPVPVQTDEQRNRQMDTRRMARGGFFLHQKPRWLSSIVGVPR